MKDQRVENYADTAREAAERGDRYLQISVPFIRGLKEHPSEAASRVVNSVAQEGWVLRHFALGDTIGKAEAGIYVFERMT